MPLIIKPSGINWRHPAARNLMLAAVPAGRNLVDLVQRQMGTYVTPGTPARSSPYLGNTLANGGQTVGWTGRTTTTSGVYTFAFIGSFQGTNSLLGICDGTVNNNGVVFGLSSSAPALKVGATTVAPGLGTITTSVPYFVAISWTQGGAKTLNGVLRRLDNNPPTGSGIVFAASTLTAAASAGNGTFQIGALSMTTAAAIYSRTFLSQSELIAWARDPWGLFRPARLPLSFMGFAAPVAADALPYRRMNQTYLRR